MLNLGRVVNKYRVRYDSWIKDAFFVDTESGTKKFVLGVDNLYKYILSTAKKVQFLKTLKENKEFYIDRQVQRAKAARKFLYIVGYPPVKDLKNIIAINGVKNCTITVGDITIAEKYLEKTLVVSQERLRGRS